MACQSLGWDHAPLRLRSRARGGEAMLAAYAYRTRQAVTRLLIGCRVGSSRSSPPLLHRCVGTTLARDGSRGRSSVAPSPRGAAVSGGHRLPTAVVGCGCCVGHDCLAGRGFLTPCLSGAPGPREMKEKSWSGPVHRTVLKTVGRVTTRLVGSNPTPSADWSIRPLTCANALTCGDAPVVGRRRCGAAVRRCPAVIGGRRRSSVLRAKCGCACLRGA